jgi:tetratricopeptide (TPR) repeat protein
LRHNPSHNGLASERAATAVLAGDVAFKAKDLPAAAGHYQDAQARCAAFANETGPWTLALATAHDRLGDVALAQGRSAAARAAYIESFRLRRAASAHGGAAHKRALAVSASKLGEAALAQGDLEAARSAFKESLRLRLGLLADDGADPILRRQVALSLERVALAALARNERQDARAAFEDELALAQEDLLMVPDDPAAQRFNAIVRCHLAGLREADAGAHRAEALRLLEAMIAKGHATAQDLALRDRLAATAG